MEDKVIANGVGPANVGRWQPEFYEYYYYISDNCRICKSAWLGDVCDVDRHNFGNFYKTKELATRARDRQLLLVELRDYADQKNAGRIIKSNSCYYLDITGGSKWMPFTMGYEMIGIIWFIDKQDADAAIAHFGDRLDLLL